MHTRWYILSALIFAMLLACSSSGSSKILWKFRTEYPVSSAPVASGNNLYVGGDKFYCLDKKTGKPVWQFETFGPVTSSPAVAYGSVYFTCGGLYCLDAASGKVLWEFWKGSWAESAPVVADGFVYIINGRAVYCLDARQGKIAWEKELDRDLSSSSIKGEGEFVYIESAGEFYCLKSADGAIVWRKIIGQEWCSYAIANNRLYVGSFADKVYCVDGQTGATIWHFNLDYSGVSWIAIEGNDLYIRADKTYCLHAMTEAVIWKSDTGKPARGKAIIYGAWLFAKSSADQIRCLDRKTGAKLWDVEVPRGSFTFADNCLFIGSPDYHVYCIGIPSA